MRRPTRVRIWFSSRAASLRLRTIRTPRCWTAPPPTLKPALTLCGLDCQTAQDYVKAADIVKKPLMAVIGGANFPATAAAMKAARVAVGQSASMVNIALGAVDRALVELKTTGRMTEAQKGALSREMSDKVEQVAELNARSRKYNLPQRLGSGTLAAQIRRRRLPHHLQRVDSRGASGGNGARDRGNAHE